MYHRVSLVAQVPLFQTSHEESAAAQGKGLEYRRLTACTIKCMPASAPAAASLVEHCPHAHVCPMPRAGDSTEEELYESMRHMRITVCEPPGQNLIIVHGRADDESMRAAGDSADATNYVTVLPSPASSSASSSPPVQSWRCVHFTYQTAPPHPVFMPMLSLLPPNWLVINRGDQVQLLRLSCTALPPQVWSCKGSCNLSLG